MGLLAAMFAACWAEQPLASVTFAVYCPPARALRSSSVLRKPFGPVQLMEKGATPPPTVRLMAPSSKPSQMLPVMAVVKVSAAACSSVKFCWDTQPLASEMVTL